MVTPGSEPDDDPGFGDDDSRVRRRAGLGFLALAVAAIVVAALMLTLSHPGHSNKPANLPGAIPSDPATSSSAAPRRTATPTRTTPKPAPTTAKPATSCATPPCALSGDPGNVVAALTAFRAGSGQKAVTGSATPAAAACALHSGDTAYCPGSYYWVRVPSPQGAACVSRIATFGGGRAWLLDPGMTKIAIGWAQPAPGQYECAVFDVSPPH